MLRVFSGKKGAGLASINVLLLTSHFTNCCYQGTASPTTTVVPTATASPTASPTAALACIDGKTPCPNGANSECVANGCDSTYSCVDQICRQLPSSAPSPAALSYTLVGNGAVSFVFQESVICMRICPSQFFASLICMLVP